jgi:DNA mismatch repair protein MutL
MSKIKIMNEILSNKIAAGEVVERSSSVVKELVENSIDANSDEIKVELIDSGVKEIKITDNGSGMEKEDALLAFSRHATSKLYNDDDLYHISSLGFRGEALPSIASVSETILKTSTGDVGTIITYKGGKLISTDNSDARRGTVITVKDLFYNTPARLKYLKSLNTELSLIVELINKLALSYPNIKFSLYNNEKKLFNSDGSNNLLKVVNEIYGLDVTKKMLHIIGENDDYDIEGFISYPEITRSTRNSIVTIVNGRIVKNIELNKIINDSYHTYKEESRYPIVVLKITVDPSIIDVNIHPAKQDIKFSKMEELKDLINNLITKKLSEVTFIRNVETKEKIIASNYEKPIFNLERTIDEHIVDSEQAVFDFEIKENTESYNEVEITKEKLPELYPIGVMRGTYIICQNENGLYLIDQHAAKERINYELYVKLLGNPNNNITDMLFPINIELPYNEYLIVNENKNILENLNFQIADFGINTITIKAHPTWLPSGYEEDAIRRIIDIIIMMNDKFNLEKFNERVAINLSCKLSIKANENISITEMENLIDDLKKCNNPFSCPHGRPTIIHFSNYELEKLFKRVL